MPMTTMKRTAAPTYQRRRSEDPCPIGRHPIAVSATGNTLKNMHVDKLQSQAVAGIKAVEETHRFIATHVEALIIGLGKTPSRRTPPL